MDYKFIFDIALILVSTKLLGLVTRRFAMPQVVGALLAGLVLGPAVLGILHETELMDQLSELGVIILMFTAGLETDIGELKRSGKASLVIATCGVLVPLAGGFLVAHFFNPGSGQAFLQNLFIGVILTATSVSITVETLKEMGKLSTRSGNAILGAALIDDVLGIIALTIITSAADPSISLMSVLLKIALFFVCAVVVGLLFHKVVVAMSNRYGDKRRIAVLALALCLLAAFSAEHFFGVADITGAYIAGLVLTKTTTTSYVNNRIGTLSYLLLSPVFFASIGLKVVLPKMTGSIIVFSVLLIVVAVVTKIIGCGISARFCGYTTAESVRIGLGMVSRGEVALIVASKGIADGLMLESYFGPVIIMVVATTVITPIMLRIAYPKAKKTYDDLVSSPLVDKYEESADLDLASQHLADMHEKIKERNSDKK